MGLFDSFFGKSQKRDLEAGKSSADQASADGYNKASNTVASGKQEASDYYKQGMSQAEAATKQGYSDANSAIDTYYGKAQTTVDDYLNQIEQNYSYYIDQGKKSQDRYNSFISGGDEQAAATQEYQKGYYAENKDSYAELARQMATRDNASGGYAGGYSGRGERAYADAAQSNYNENKKIYLDRLERASSRGQSATDSLSGYQASGGQYKAGLYANQGNQKSANYSAQGNALADLYYKGNSALANNSQQAASQQSQYDYNYGQGQADRNTSYSNALASSRSTGWNNLIGLGSAAASAYSGYNTANNLSNLFKKTG